MRPWLRLAAALLATTACTRAAPARTTVQQYMEGEVNPAADFLFRSVREVSDARGTRLEAPRSAAEWTAVRDQLAVLQAAPEVLGAKGLKAAPPGSRSEHPGVESEPAWIQQAIDSNRADFNRRARRLRQAADGAVQAVEAHDPRALQRALDGVDKACESCHLHYFYPGDKRAWQAAKDDGVVD
jgi:cytochrome c556